MVSSLYLLGAAALFSIVGTVAAIDAAPAIPRKVSQANSGKAFGYRKNAENYLLSDQLEFSWDLDRECVALYQYNYLAIRDW